MFALNPNESTTARVTPEDAEGNAMLDPNTLTWSADANCVSLASSADGLTCVVSYVSAGTANVTVTDGTFTSSPVAITCQPGPLAQLVVTLGPAQAVAPVSQSSSGAPAA
jgi:hypothetical protein